MDGNIAIWTVTELQLSQSQSTLISRRPVTGLPTARPITEHLNFAITGSGEWSAEILFIFDENVTLPLSVALNCMLLHCYKSILSPRNVPKTLLVVVLVISVNYRPTQITTGTCTWENTSNRWVLYQISTFYQK